VPSNFRRLSFLVALLGGLSAAAVDPVRAETTETYDWGSAVPISTAGPAWYDDAYYQQVIANGVAGTSLPSAAQMPDDGTYAAAGTTSTGERR